MDNSNPDTLYTINWLHCLTSSQQINSILFLYWGYEFSQELIVTKHFQQEKKIDIFQDNVGIWSLGGIQANAGKS